MRYWAKSLQNDNSTRQRPQIQCHQILMKNIKYFSLYSALIIFASCAGDDNPELRFEAGEYQQAYRLWIPLARENNLKAINYLGIHHYLGLGVEKDFQLARKYFQEAAEQGYPDAQLNLGLLYQAGNGVKVDSLKAFMWFFAAYEQGNNNALKHLKRIAENHKLMPNQMTYATTLAEPYILNRVDREEEAPLRNY